MTRTKITFIIFAATIIICFLVFGILLFNKKGKEGDMGIKTNGGGQGVMPSEDTSLTTGTTEISEEARTQLNLENLVRSFVERFGSYSNHSDFKNIIELKPLMTESMSAWIDQYVSKNRQRNAPYHGYTTRSLSIKEVVSDPERGATEYLVSTQRQEFTGSMDNFRTYYQDINVKLVRVGNDWRVDGAYWK